MYYYEVMMFASQALLTRVIEMHYWQDKTFGQIFWMVLFLILGTNAWIESTVMFFSISLNLTTRELFFTNSYLYLKPLKKVEEVVHYRYSCAHSNPKLHVQRRPEPDPPAQRRELPKIQKSPMALQPLLQELFQKLVGLFPAQYRSRV